MNACNTKLRRHYCYIIFDLLKLFKEKIHCYVIRVPHSQLRKFLFCIEIHSLVAIVVGILNNIILMELNNKIYEAR